MKRTLLLSLLVVTVITISQTPAASLETLLPDSSHYQGYTYYDETVTLSNGSSKYMRGRIDFAVYDTLNGNEWAVAGSQQPSVSSWDNPGNGRYVYAYQIFNDYDDNSQVAIDSFSILGLNNATMSIIADSIACVEDPMGGQEAKDTSCTDTLATWDFSYGNTDYTIGINEHSFFLVLSSDYDWVTGTYDITAYDPDFPTPGDDDTTQATPTPEPMTIALFGLGSLFTLKRRKKMLI